MTTDDWATIGKDIEVLFFFCKVTESVHVQRTPYSSGIEPDVYVGRWIFLIFKRNS